jgi:hypothetical protein
MADDGMVTGSVALAAADADAADADADAADADADTDTAAIDGVEVSLSLKAYGHSQRKVTREDKLAVVSALCTHLHALYTHCRS